MTDDPKHDPNPDRRPEGETTGIGGGPAGAGGEGDKPKVARKSLGKDPTMPIRLDRKLWKQMKDTPPGSGAPPPPPPLADTEDVVLDDNLEVVWPAGEGAPTPSPASQASALPAYSRTAPTPPPPDRPSTPLPTNRPAAEEEWVGSEQTMIGGAVPAGTPPPVAAKPAELPREEGWKGDERTMVGMAPNPADEAAAAAWTGNEATAVGIPAPKMVPPGETGGEEWAGREATLLGMNQAGGSLSIESASDIAERKKREGTGTGSGTGGKSASRTTNPTMDDAWHLKGRKGPLTGKTLGDYEIGGILGEGGMGTVYRARQISLKRRVALKVLPPNLAQDLRLRERFEIEARTASLLNTPHVVAVFAAGTQDDIVYFVMEYVEGTDLSAIINEKKDRGEKMTVEEAAGYILQAARGLAEAGKHNIVHRDIKPPNLMVTTKGVVKIADFGISKVAGEHGLTMTGTAVGTPAYCSPEQGRGDQVDARADIYSLGVVFYELLTGQKPFDGTSANALIYQHNYAEPPLPSSIDAAISEQYQAVVMKCLQKDPAKRYQDAAELVTDLERIRDGNMSLTAVFSAKFGTGADEAMSRYLGVKKRTLWPYFAAAAVLVVGLGVGGYAFSNQTAHDNELKRLRGILTQLDSPHPLPGGAKTALDSYRAIKGKDADWTRWNDKIDEVQKLKGAEHLARLDGLSTAVVPWDLYHDSSTDLDGLKVLIGDGDPDETRWEGKLDASGKLKEALRGQLKADLDTAPVITEATVTRDRPSLDRFKQLANDKDADYTRWKKKCDDLFANDADLRKSLAALDGKELPTETEIASHTNELATLSQAEGDTDEVLRWRDAIKRDGDVIAQLREHCRKLDGVESLNLALRNEVTPDLEKLKKLVDANDPQLSRWVAQVEAAEAADKQVRGELARLDEGTPPLTQKEQDSATINLARLRKVVSDDDADVARWTKRLTSEQAQVEDRRKTLARLNDAATLTVAEQDACAKAATALAALDFLGADEKARIDARIAHDRAVIQEKRAALAALKERHAPINAALARSVDEFARLVGDQDPDAKDWNNRIAEYRRLHAALADLDKATALPRDVDGNLEKFAAIVGNDDEEYAGWKRKVDQVRLLRGPDRLGSLDRHEPIQANARDDLKALVGYVGRDEDDVQRWTKKIDLVDVLVANLTAQLGTDQPGHAAYVLPDEASAPRDVVELARDNVGTSEALVRWWIARVALLKGPPSPGWASESGRDQFGPWAELTVSGIKQRFRYIPAGEFMMGSDEKTEKGRDADELHVHVTLTHSYWLAESECTQGLWKAVVAASPAAGLSANPSRFISDERPVERVSWDDSHDFVVALSKLKESGGMVARLPSEAEWEYACRGGLDAARSSYQGEVPESKLDTIAWFAGDAQGSTKGVNRRLPNLLGLHDMLGNVWEWTDDNYGTYAPNAVDPHGRQEETRVVRGGSWGDAADHLRAANRLALRQDMRTVYVGFRLAADVAWPGGKVPSKDQADTLLPGLLQDPSAAAAPAAAVAAPAPVVVAAPAPEAH
jgi:formylglycine-generating enzyme required for sulfatase activity/tRNA A-37 threonylcarbamoyl transferase component Bud32